LTTSSNSASVLVEIQLTMLLIPPAVIGCTADKTVYTIIDD